MGRKGRDAAWLGPTPTAQRPISRRDNNPRGLHWGMRGSKPHTVFHSLGHLHWEDNPPWYLTLKTDRAYVWESCKPCQGNWDPIPKERLHNLTRFEPQCRSSSLKSTWITPKSDPLTNFRACARGTGICWNILQGQKQWQVPFFLCVVLYLF